MAPGSAFDPRRDRAVAKDVVRSGWLRNFVPSGLNRRRKPTPRAVSQEFRVLLASPPKEKIARCPRCLGDFRVNFPPLRAARTNRQSRVKATTVRETDASPAIVNSEQHRGSVRIQSAALCGQLIAFRLAKAVRPSLPKWERSTIRVQSKPRHPI